MAKMTEKQDMKLDKKLGIRENSKADLAKDKKMGVVDKKPAPKKKK